MVFAGQSAGPGSTGVGLAADASQDPNASAAPDASEAPEASEVPGKGGDRGWGRGPGGFGRGGFVGPGGPGGPGLFGGGVIADGRHSITISDISGSQLSLQTEDGWTRTIDASGAKITREGTAITLADLKVGDTIRFAETRNADGTYTITEIAVILPRVGGTATAVGTDTITVSQRDGTSQTVHVGSGTTFSVPGVTNATIADVKVGNLVVAAGSLRDDGSLDATTVTVFNGQRGGRGPGNDGDSDDANASPAPSTAPAG